MRQGPNEPSRGKHSVGGNRFLAIKEALHQHTTRTVQVDLNSASAALDLLSSTGMVARVELRLSARGLPKKDKLR